MTLKEVSLLLGRSESTILNCFPRLQANLKKKGILLMKWGRGKDAEYEVEYTALDQLEEQEEEED